MRQAEETKYRAIFENSLDAIFLTLSDGTITSANPAAQDMLGMTEEEIRKTGRQGIVVNDEGLRKGIEERARTGKFRGVMTFRRKDGTRLPVEVSSVVFMEDSSPHAMVVGRDISERIKMEEQFQDSSRKFNRIFNSNIIGFVIADAKGHIYEANDHYLGIIGYTREDLRQKKVDWKKMTPPEYLPRDHKGIEELERTGVSTPYEKEYVAKDGRRKWVLISDAMLTRALIIAFVQDITERKEAEALLRESRDRLNLAVEGAGLGLYDIDLESGEVIWNERSCEFFGVPRGRKMMLREVQSLIYAEDRKQTVDTWNRALSPSSNGEYAAEYRVLMPEGTLRWIVSIGHVYYKGEGTRRKACRIIGILQDITERKKAEEILRRDRETLERLITERSYRLVETQKELDRSRRLSDLGKLAATIAHELRNPLAAIGLAGSSIRRKAQNPAIERSAENIRRKVDESDEIIDNLLLYARLKRPEVREVNICDLIRETAVSSKERHVNRPVKIEIRDAQARGTLVSADPVQIREVFSNILNNSIEAIPEKRQGKIGVDIHKSDGHASIRISDNGAGVSPENLDKIFEPFFSTKARGTGLGLPVVSQIVEMHKGKIKISSEEGKGTTVEIELPLHQ
ncbi:MAG: PAS domain S-box protein [Deltaproteobacteria bacterium]